MGQTLTHGVYLPDEGERNCYSGLAANWQILDTSVGTIAAHTAALAGKANAVHTHTKADITDFPAYGNAAGTICEGNDSRLSDARTPVAHTHTKSDVTDLLNSNFIPSANNSYGLGSSSYQWNNLYAKNYYYNGTAWGLDKYNTWTNSQAYKLTGTEVGSTTSGYISLSFTDKNNAWLGLQRVSVYSDGRTCMSWKIYNTDSNSQSISSSLEYYISKAGVKVFAPVENGEIGLGTSTSKWKTLNGINPGALSLPNLTMQTYDPNNGWYGLDTTGWDLTGSPIDISSNVLKDGYLYICLACDSTGYVIICEGVFGYPNCYYSTSGLPISGYARALLPVRKGTGVRLYLKGTSVYGARLFPALGNV